MKRIYLKDIAKDLNVSKTAVSLVLNNKGDENKISLDTQQKILDYAKKHNYVPNQLARGLSRGKSETKICNPNCRLPHLLTGQTGLSIISISDGYRNKMITLWTRGTIFFNLIVQLIPNFEINEQV